MVKKKKYTGILAKPLVVRMPSVFDEPDARRVFLERELKRRTSALYAHYDISELSIGAEARLALALAIDWVPGFQLKKAERAASIWKYRGGCELLADVWVLTLDGTTSALKACATLATDPRYIVRYRGLGARKATPKSLYRRYMEVTRVGKRLSTSPVLKDMIISAVAFDENARVTARTRWEKFASKARLGE